MATGHGARLGILFRSAQAIETARKLTTIVFDKTGTLTEGHPQVTEIMSYEMAEEEMLRLAASAEFGSEHGLAAAILEAPPATPDPAATYVFYLHGRIVQQQGRHAVSAEHGPYYYDAIVERL